MTDTAKRQGGEVGAEQRRLFVDPISDLSEGYLSLNSITRKSLKGMSLLKVANLVSYPFDLKDQNLVESSFFVRDSLSKEAVGFCLAHFAGPSDNQSSSTMKIDMIAAVPGSMAGPIIMQEILRRMNEYDVPAEFVALSNTTGKILRRKTARQALDQNGWEMKVIHGPGPVRHDKTYPYQSELIRLERQ